MNAVFPAVAFFGALIASRVSLGISLAWILIVGYFSGLIRANYLSVWTTFMFDSAVFGLYLGFILNRRYTSGLTTVPLAGWVIALIGWPLLLSLIPINNFLVQMVAFRSTAAFLPVLLVATRLTDGDLRAVARALAVLNYIALSVGIYMYFYGVEALYPINPVTEIIYRSRDAGGGYHRIPSTFLSAHAYGGTMLASAGFLVYRMCDRTAGRFERMIMAGAGLAAVLGVLLCAARQPLIAGAVICILSCPMSGFSRRSILIAVCALGISAYMAMENERFQRILSLDAEKFQGRIYGSANEGLIDLFFEYPLGAGMGSSVGTSIPFFLADQAPEQIGLENEYCRILVDQGWFGLGLWIAFLVWVHSSVPSVRASGAKLTGIVFLYCLSVITWVTAIIGTGTLSSVPGSVLLLCAMGVFAQRLRPGRLSRWQSYSSTRADPAPTVASNLKLNTFCRRERLTVGMIVPIDLLASNTVSHPMYTEKWV